MENNDVIISRSEQKKENTWALEDLYVTDDAFYEAFHAFEKQNETLASYRGKLSSARSLLEFYDLGEAAERELLRLINYAQNKYNEDTGNAVYADMNGRTMSLITKFTSAISFEDPELNALSDESLDGFFKEVPALEKYRRRIGTVRRLRAHTLSASEEKLLADAGEMANAPSAIFTAFDDADLKFPDAVDAQGKSHPLTHGSYIPLMESHDRILRRSAFENLYHTFEGYKNTSAAMLDAQFRALAFNSRARRYSSSLEAALYGNEVPVEVYTNLISTVHANMDAMYGYMDLRRRLMGLDELHMYDLYSPIVSDCDVRIDYEKAKSTVLGALSVLGDKYTSMLRDGFDHRWVDVYENKGKLSGAYSSGCTPHPYVLLNYKNTLDSMFTLAHEMGHSLHSVLSVENQPYIYSQYVIFVAEVASTCNEVLLMLQLLDKTSDRREKAYLINYFLEQFRTTLYRQTMFAEFELECSKKVEAGETLTADSACGIYYKLNQLYYGEDVKVDREIAMEWARIPHFYMDFYVFQYATGFSAAVAIAQKIIKEGAPARDAYLKFLSGGCSADPISLLRIAGADMASPEPVSDAIALFRRLTAEMKDLMS